MLSQPAGVPVAAQERSQVPFTVARPALGSQDAAATSAPGASGWAGS